MRVFLGGLWLYLTIFLAWLLLALPEAPRQDLVDLAYLPLHASAALGCFAAARFASVTRRDRWGWLCVGLAWATSFGGALFWALPGDVPWEDRVAQALYDSYYLFTFTGLVLLAALPRERMARQRLLADAAVVLCSTLVLAWYFILRYDEALREAPLRLNEQTITYSGELLLLVMASVVLHRPRRLGGELSLRALTVGIFASALGDLMMEQAFVEQSNLLRGVSALSVGLGAALVASAGLLRQQPPGDRTLGPFADAELPGAAALPYLAMGVVLALLLLELGGVSEPGTPVPGLAIGSIVLTVLVVARLVLAQRDLGTAAAARAAQDSRFRGLVHRSREAVLLVGTDGLVRYASPATLAILGEGAADPAGQPLSALAHPTDRERLQAALATPTDGQTLSWRMGYGGRWQDVESVVTDLRDEPAVAGVVLNTRDVTERNRLESQLRQAQKLDALGRLASGIAHDFNNLLTAIKGNSYLARGRAPAAVHGDLDEIDRATERGAALCRQVLAFSRSEPLRLAFVDLARVVREVEPLVRRLLPASITLETEGEPGETGTIADETQVEMALINLAVNARDAMPDGGNLRMATDVIEVAPGDRWHRDAIPVGRYARLRVRDTGAGMDEATLSRLFEPFFTTKPTGQGTGLGLSMVHRIMQGSGGHIRAESRPGQGTCMTLLFPFEPPRPVVARAPAAPPPVASGGRILLAEDEAALRVMIARYLREQGFEVIEAEDGLEALAALDRSAWKVDLVLTDLNMPQISGYQLVRHIRARRPDLRILCMTGQTVDQAALGEPGTIPLLPKPFSLEALLHQVVALLPAAPVPVETS